MCGWIFSDEIWIAAFELQRLDAGGNQPESEDGVLRSFLCIFRGDGFREVWSFLNNVLFEFFYDRTLGADKVIDA